MVQNHWAYNICYYMVYVYMLLNDSIKLYFFPKWADYAFHGLTVVSIIAYAIDIVFRSTHEKKYFL